MKSILTFISISLIATSLVMGQATVLRKLPGEFSAEEVLDGKYPFPPSPAVDVRTDLAGFAAERISKIPAPGVHPRILLSPEDLPDLRRRLEETETGRALYKTLRQRTTDALRNPQQWSSELYLKLAAGDAFPRRNDASDIRAFGAKRKMGGPNRAAASADLFGDHLEPRRQGKCADAADARRPRRTVHARCR